MQQITPARRSIEQARGLEPKADGEVIRQIQRRTVRHADEIIDAVETQRRADATIRRARGAVDERAGIRPRDIKSRVARGFIERPVTDERVRVRRGIEHREGEGVARAQRAVADGDGN